MTRLYPSAARISLEYLKLNDFIGEKAKETDKKLKAKAKQETQKKKKGKKAANKAPNLVIVASSVVFHLGTDSIFCDIGFVRFHVITNNCRMNVPIYYVKRSHEY
eukprot:20577_1